MRPEIPTLPPVRLPWILAVILAALLLAYCADNRLSDGGTSSGVDNPSLTVGFLDASGKALRVSGDLDIYTADQNPAVDPEPLVTLKIKNSAFTNLTGNDFERLLSPAASKRASESLSKASAVGPLAAADSAVTLFNIILRTKDRTGSLALGFKYDSTAKTFTRTVDGAALQRFDLLPKPLVRYAARIAREAVHGTDGRVFVPGSPFQATLVDSQFILEDMPEGLFPLRLLAADGKVYAVADSLNTLDSTLIYRPRPTPLGSIDTVGQNDVPFAVEAGEPLQAYIGTLTQLDGKIIGASPNDARLSVIWRHLKDSADTIQRDTLPHPPASPPVPPKPDSGLRKVEILKPTSLKPEIRFTAEGYYRFEFRATLGVRSQADTVTVSVTKKPPPTPRIVLPGPGDTVRTGRAYPVQWEMPKSGPVTISVSLDSGRAWIELARGYTAKDLQPVYPWIPAESLGSSNRCLLKVRSEADSTLEAGMDAMFRLMK
jgi:hypothetical protein